MLAATSTRPLHLRGITTTNEELVVRLGNPSAGTRVHVAASRYLPTFDAFAHLRGLRAAPAELREVERTESSYHAGRQLGDEYRYVLERRFATKYPGNMLRRPSLLLNPWSIDDDSWNSAVGLGGGSGGRFGGRAGGGRGKAAAAPAADAGGLGASPGAFANLDYLPRRRAPATTSPRTRTASCACRSPNSAMGTSCRCSRSTATRRSRTAWCATNAAAAARAPAATGARRHAAPRRAEAHRVRRRRRHGRARRRARDAGRSLRLAGPCSAC
jgi:hypothetical protein